MDASIHRSLNDKLYDKRKAGALDLENVIREASASRDHEKIKKIIHQLCHEYAYAVHAPYARNGGLIGLAAAAIALGPEVAQYLEEIVPPVLACFTDQDARVRYYACESMYNIAKVAKGELLLYFNDVFDALSKLAADSELSVKNGAELLDRLVKDIVSESASTYVSILHHDPEQAIDDKSIGDGGPADDLPTAFSLARFIPLLTERIFVINPFTRTFLVSWITLLDSIPDLELVVYLPAFLGGLFRFLSDPNADVHVATQGCLERFLAEIRRIARIKRGVEDVKKERRGERDLRPSSSSSPEVAVMEKPQTDEEPTEHGSDMAVSGDEEEGDDGETEDSSDGDWVPGQDVQVDHPKILEILVTFLDSTSGKRPSSVPHQIASESNVRGAEEEIQLTALRWVESFFEICPEDILPFVPRLLSQVLPAMASTAEPLRQAAHRVNTSLMDYIRLLSEASMETMQNPPTPVSRIPADKESRRKSTPNALSHSPQRGPLEGEDPGAKADGATQASDSAPSKQTLMDLDYAAAVNALTLQFLNENEATRVGALTWLIMLHQKAPRKVLAINDETFPALLKTLSDPAEAVVTRDLQLLSQISRDSADDYFTSFMVNLLQLFCTDRRLLETRGNLIIRQLCVSLSAERIYRTLADCLEKDEDVEFASIMVQNLNNNLITAPELADLRKRLRNLDSRDGQTFFVALFRSWCHNAVATFSLCLLAQAYEQAYHLLQIFAELEMTINMLIQIDKLVQLLESPVFTYLRLQLLEPEKHPHLYKCLYGLLMLLPQSSAFALLKNRLNAVSAIGYLHVTPRPAPPTPSSSTYERPNRLKGGRDGESGGGVRWTELLEKFRAVQEKARRQASRKRVPFAGRGLLDEQDEGYLHVPGPISAGLKMGNMTATSGASTGPGGQRPITSTSTATGGVTSSIPARIPTFATHSTHSGSQPSMSTTGASFSTPSTGGSQVGAGGLTTDKGQTRARSGLGGNIGRFAGGVASGAKKSKK